MTHTHYRITDIPRCLYNMYHYATPNTHAFFFLNPLFSRFSPLSLSNHAQLVRTDTSPATISPPWLADHQYSARSTPMPGGNGSKPCCLSRRRTPPSTARHKRRVHGFIFSTTPVLSLQEACSVLIRTALGFLSPLGRSPVPVRNWGAD